MNDGFIRFFPLPINVTRYHQGEGRGVVSESMTYSSSLVISCPSEQHDITKSAHKFFPNGIESKQA
jgi:hypothetical protein